MLWSTTTFLQQHTDQEKFVIYNICKAEVWNLLCLILLNVATNLIDGHNSAQHSPLLTPLSFHACLLHYFFTFYIKWETRSRGSAFKSSSQIFLSHPLFCFTYWHLSWNLPVFVQIKHEPCNNQGYERHKNGSCHRTAVWCKMVSYWFWIIFHHADVWNTAKVTKFQNTAAGNGVCLTYRLPPQGQNKLQVLL